MSKEPSLKEILSLDTWVITNLNFDEEFKKYHFTATHKEGEVLEMSKTDKEVNKAIKQIEDEN